jgi:hypothetical protein
MKFSKVKSVQTTSKQPMIVYVKGPQKQINDPAGPVNKKKLGNMIMNNKSNPKSGSTMSWISSLLADSNEFSVEHDLDKSLIELDILFKEI